MTVNNNMCIDAEAALVGFPNVFVFNAGKFYLRSFVAQDNIQVSDKQVVEIANHLLGMHDRVLAIEHALAVAQNAERNAQHKAKVLERLVRVMRKMNKVLLDGVMG